VLAVPLEKPRKKLRKRAPRDRSQALRRSVQIVFLALNVWIGLEFYLFVRYCETGGRSIWIERPPGVEGWLPIAALMNWKVFAATGRMPTLHPAGMLLLAVGSMSVEAIRAFLNGPYGIVDDVKMLNFFRFLGLAGWIVIAALAAASLFIQNFWCRYLCPYGALMGLAGLASPLRIRRDRDWCIDCARCAKACPSQLPVDRLVSIRSAECTGCLECVAACPAAGALFLSAPRRKRVPAWAVAGGVAFLFLGGCGWARWTRHWQTQLPTQVYMHLVPRANEFSHP
jgi:polyferredoxin